MKKPKYRFICAVLVVLLGVFIFNTGKGEAETVTQLILMPDKASFLDPDYLYLDIMVETGTTPINAVLAGLTFENEHLSLERIDYERSFCSFFIYENIDNPGGSLDVACADSEAVAGGKYNVATLVFKKLSTGWSKFSFTDSSAVLAHDGLGTDLLGGSELHSIYITK